jgi:hypothetical protein
VVGLARGELFVDFGEFLRAGVLAKTPILYKIILISLCRIFSVFAFKPPKSEIFAGTARVGKPMRSRNGTQTNKHD